MSYEPPRKVGRAKVIIRRGTHYIMYRLRLRWPKRMAKIERELPMRPLQDIFTDAAAAGRPIPNVVYMTWVDNMFGRKHAKGLRKFRDANPDYSFRLFTQEDCDRYMREVWGDHPIHQIYKNALFGPLAADIWRYCIMFDRGGVYCDIGKAIAKPLSDVIPADADAVITWEERTKSPYMPSALACERLQMPDRVMVNWGLAFTAGHSLMRRVIDGIVAKYPEYQGKAFEAPKSAILRFTGPFHLTECLLAAAEAGELGHAAQLGVEFEGAAINELPGSWVRYIARAPYILAVARPIVT